MISYGILIIIHMCAAYAIVVLGLYTLHMYKLDKAKKIFYETVFNTEKYHQFDNRVVVCHALREVINSDLVEVSEYWTEELKVFYTENLKENNSLIISKEN